MRARVGFICMISLCMGCESTTPTSVPTNVTSVAGEEPQGYKLETVASGLRVPWAIVFAPDGRMIFTERPGRVRVIQDGKLLEEPLHIVADVEQRSESGLMGLCLHPAFASNKLLYLAYTSKDGSVQVVRFREEQGKLVERKMILGGVPAAPNHAGCFIAFGPDSKLYITTGDATERRLAQRLDSLAGKTLRLNDDGSIPKDNPFVGRSEARAEIWTYGHRNAQGMDWQPSSGLMFQTEHGPSGFDGPGGGDEVNIVEKGKNYGWPLVHHQGTREGTVAPIALYTPAEAPATAKFYDGDKLPWRGNFIFACLRGNGLNRMVLDGRKVVSQEKLFEDLGRCRALAVGPDGYLYFGTSNRDGRGRAASTDDRILRVVPAG